MAAINELISQIEDKTLRDRIQEEVNRLAKRKKFGLVFEEHLPECTPLYDIPVKKGANTPRFMDEKSAVICKQIPRQVHIAQSKRILTENRLIFTR